MTEDEIVPLGDDDYMTRKQASDYLTREWGFRCSVRTLESYSSREDITGPRYEVRGNRALYRRSDLDAWARSRCSGRITRARDAANYREASRA